MSAPNPPTEKPATTSLLVRAGRAAGAAVLVVAVWQALSGWQILFSPQPSPERFQPTAADRWESLPTTLAAPGQWRVIGAGWTAELQTTSPDRPVECTLRASPPPDPLPPATDEELGIVQLIAHLSPERPPAADGQFLRRGVPFSWGHVAAATVYTGQIERLIELVVSIRGTSGGYCVRVQPADENSQISRSSFPLTLLPDSFRLGTKFDTCDRPICEVWLTGQSANACRSAWEADGWNVETAPPSAEFDSVCLLTRTGESICALLPASAKSQATLLLLVRLLPRERGNAPPP